ncbi:MAG TPA: hypothetical protein VKX17_10990 [Planctomycetota bacterium]|nr:hypothetical protein [Planctomycetota bacterium]
MRKFALAIVAVVMLVTFVGCGESTSTPTSTMKPTTGGTGTK